MFKNFNPPKASVPLGYLLGTTNREHAPGHPTVDIWLAETPSQRHFDPEQVRLNCFIEAHVDALAIEHPWSGERTAPLAAGMLILIDRKNKHIDGFLFGGNMEIEVESSFTHIHLSSPAPIMLRRNDHPEINLLIEEACILLARRRAVWAEHPEELEQRLFHTDPLTLYAAFLISINHNFDQLPPSDDETLLKARYIIHREFDVISRQLPGFELPLENLC